MMPRPTTWFRGLGTTANALLRLIRSRRSRTVMQLLLRPSQKIAARITFSTQICE